MEILLDKVRNIKFPLSSIEKLEDVSGENCLTGEYFSKMTAKKLKLLLWAGLLHEDKALTIEAVSNLLDQYQVSELLDKVSHAYKLSLDPTDDEKKNNG